jgi:transcriptional regulator with XRE-family HTH domain
MAQRSKPADSYPYRQFGSYLKDLANEWERHKRRRFVQRAAAEEMHIDSTSISKFMMGKVLPTPRQCLLLAQFFDRRVEEVLRTAGYPDVQELAQAIEDDPTPRDAAVKKRVIDVLRMAQRSPLWQQLHPDNPYKEHANRILASDEDPYQKAVDYTDMVWFWYRSLEQNTPRGARKTDDLLPVVS